MSRYCENRPSLSEVMRTPEPARQNKGALPAQLAIGVPPTCKVHLTHSRDDKAKFQKPLKIQIQSRPPSRVDLCRPPGRCVNKVLDAHRHQSLHRRVTGP
jgi:hypothetical protein